MKLEHLIQVVCFEEDIHCKRFLYITGKISKGYYCVLTGWCSEE